jgi:hypothetical protein
VAAVSAPVLWVPLVANVPVHAPDAVQAVALVELHVNAEAAPLVTAVGFAVNVAVGFTLTVALAGALVPPMPVQVSVNKDSEVTGAVIALLFKACAPLQLFEAVQLVAWVELHANVEVPP